MTNLGSERLVVQNPLIGYAVDIGWAYLSPEEALSQRRGASGNLLYSILRDRLIALNPGVVNVSNADEIISRIESVRCNIEGNAEVLAWMRGEHSIYVETENRRRNVTLVDFEHPANNIFQVTDEWEYTNGQYTNRADIIFLINGVPVAIVETKSAKDREGIDKGLTQIRRYHNETPELLTAPQVFDITHLLDFYYGVTWTLDRKNIFKWKEEERENFEKKVKNFFSRERFLKLLQEWIVFFKKEDELKKIVLRQHQIRAVEKVVERSFDPVKKTGLVWHTQGSGKTFTMIKAAQQILNHTAFEKPTVLMLVDRNELEGQLAGWIASVLGEGKAELARSKQHLKELFTSDYRGLIISMIHKFDKADAGLSTKSNIFVLVDEAHRTTTGDLGNYLVGALPNATMIGFTGTPIDKIAYGKGTFKVFGKDDPKGYLDKYSIIESIEDETTLPLHYTLAPNDIRVPREQLEKEFLDLVEAEGVSDIEELNEILDRAVNLKAFLKADKRRELVVKFVAKHFKENVEPLGYKAFLVGVDREACALYKKELDKYLPPEYSTVVYTSAHNDAPLLTEFKIGEDEEKQIRKAFLKKDAFPKILIVTEKLLTGFDAPVLYCMYLDKPMRDHTLLQAIARVNRPYEENDIKKPSGFVVDFVGVFEKLEEALAFDSDEVDSVIKNIDVLKKQFEALMKEQAPPCLNLYKGQIDDKAVEGAIDFFSDKSKRGKFYDFFKNVEMLYEIISPDPFLRPYIEDYRKISILYQIIKNAFSTRPNLYSDLMRKTEAIVREHVEAYGFIYTMPVIKMDDKALKALKEGQAPDTTKVINLVKTLTTLVHDGTDKQRYLVSIGERAEKIMESYDDRQITTQDALRELEKLLQEYLNAKDEFEKTGLDINTFTICWTLKQSGIEKPEELAHEIDATFKKFPDYAHNPSEMRQLKAELYKLLLPIIGKGSMVELAEKLFRFRNP